MTVAQDYQAVSTPSLLFSPFTVDFNGNASQTQGLDRPSYKQSIDGKSFDISAPGASLVISLHCVIRVLGKPENQQSVDGTDASSRALGSSLIISRHCQVQTLDEAIINEVIDSNQLDLGTTGPALIITSNKNGYQVRVLNEPDEHQVVPSKGTKVHIPESLPKPNAPDAEDGHSAIYQHTDKSSTASSGVPTVYSTVKTPAELRKRLLSQLHIRGLGTDDLLLNEVEEPIGIGKLQRTNLSLLPSAKLFSPRPDGDFATRDQAEYTTYLRFVNGESKSLVVDKDCTNIQFLDSDSPGGAEEPDIFLPLGWLVEENDTGFHRTTRYVCALSLSTNPASMWLIFDYVFDQFGESFIEDTATWYNDELFDHGQEFDRCSGECEGTNSLMGKTAGYLNQEKPFDIALLYRNVEDWSINPLNHHEGMLPTLSFKVFPLVGLALQAVRTMPSQAQLDRAAQAASYGSG